MNRVHGLAFLLVSVLGTVACSSGKGTKDAGLDAAAEVRPEVGPDAPADTAPDAPADAKSDASADVAPDAPVDAAPDAPADAAPDAPADVAPEVHPACMTIPTTATRTVHLRITADNECDVYVNGALTGTTTSWPSPVTMDVSLYVYPGRVNVIAVEGRNTSSQGGPDRGVIGQLEDLSDGGSKIVVLTDATWRSSKTGGTGWQAPSFDDSAWDAATVAGDHGSSPWGALLGTSDAKWIWTAPIPASTSDKPDAETGYFRKRFFFGVDGEVTSTPGCPLLTP